MPRLDVGVCVRKRSAGSRKCTSLLVPRGKFLKKERLADRKELNNYETGNLIPPGVYTLDDVKKYGQEKGVCPYFTIRRMVHSAHC
jgi:hypothetical protein